MDDFIEGGNEMHRETMEGFYDKYRCGKAIDLRLAGQEGTRFDGRRVVQHPDFRITVRRGSETMSRSSHHHHDLAHFFYGAALDDNHRFKFRHWRATAAPTR